MIKLSLLFQPPEFRSISRRTPFSQPAQQLGLGLVPLFPPPDPGTLMSLVECFDLPGSVQCILAHFVAWQLNVVIRRSRFLHLQFVTRCSIAVHGV